MRARASALFLLASTLVCSAWFEGGVCEGLSNTTASKDMLRGRHLMVVDIEWSPFLKIDASKSGNARYSGVDIDLLNEIANLLGFTYSIAIESLGSGESWTDVIFRSTRQSDVLMSWWDKYVERLNNPRVVFLEPHIDLSYQMVTFKPVVEEPTFIQRMITFTLPFKPLLWLVIFALLGVMGIGIYMVEKMLGDNLASNYPMLETVYEAFALFTQAGAPAPVTAPGRMLLLILGFSIVVIVSAYTANLASYLTVRASEVQTISSVDDLVSQQQNLCAAQQFTGFVHTTFPSVSTYFEDTWTGDSYAYQGLRDGKCGAYLVTQIQRTAEKTIDEFCDTTVVQTLDARRTGWIVSPSAPCVLSSFNWALRTLIEGGAVNNLLRKHFVEAVCPSADAAGVTNDQLLVRDLSGVFALNLILLICCVASARIPAFNRRFHTRCAEDCDCPTHAATAPQNHQEAQSSVEMLAQLTQALADASRLAEALAVKDSGSPGGNGEGGGGEAPVDEASDPEVPTQGESTSDLEAPAQPANEGRREPAFSWMAYYSNDA